MWYTYWLACVEGITGDRKCELCRKNGSAEAVYYIEEKGNREQIITEKEWGILKESKKKRNWREAYQKVVDRGIQMAVRGQNNYPKRFEELARMPYALLIGVLIAFTALIPIFGAFIGCAVGSFLIFMVSPKQAIIFIIVFLVLQQIEGNLIYPHVVGESVGLPSIWVLAAVTIGGNLMGIVGMLVFIPLLSVFYTIFREFVYLRLKKKHIKQVTKTEIEEYTVEEIVNSDISEGK